jgi:hypothetical protein
MAYAEIVQRCGERPTRRKKSYLISWNKCRTNLKIKEVTD